MKFNHFNIFIVTITLFTINSVWAKPTKVTLYPNSGLIEDVMDLTPTKNNNELTVTFELPSQVEPSRVLINPENGVSILNVSWVRNLIQEDASSKELENENLQLTALLAKKRAINAAINFWQQQIQSKDPFTNRETSVPNFANQLTKNMESNYIELAEVELEIDKQNDKIELLMGDRDPRRHDWKISISFVSDKIKDVYQFNCTYMLNGIGWKPLYTLNASPSKKSIDFSWTAMVWQNTHQDWDNVDVTLTTIAPDILTSPSALSPWIIDVNKPKPIVIDEPQYSKSLTISQSRTKSLYSGTNDQVAQPAISAEHYTFATWNLGKHNLKSSLPATLLIKRESWPASFTHILRPSIYKNSFVKASVYFSKDKQLLKGDTIFMLDGNMIGKKTQDFTPSTSKDNSLVYHFFFGEDKLVTSTVSVLANTKDIIGTFTKKQKYVRNIKIEINNMRTTPVIAVVEKSKPKVHDKRIDSKFIYNPIPNAEDTNSESIDDLLIWRLPLNAKQKVDITMNAEIEALLDLQIDLGSDWK